MKVEFVPFNRYVLVERTPLEEKPEPTILLPEEYRKVQDTHEVVKVLDCSPNCAFRDRIPRGSKIVVLANFLEDLKVAGETHTVVLENHIIGRLCEHSVEAE